MPNSCCPVLTRFLQGMFFWKSYAAVDHEERISMLDEHRKIFTVSDSGDESDGDDHGGNVKHSH